MIKKIIVLIILLIMLSIPISANGCLTYNGLKQDVKAQNDYGQNFDQLTPSQQQDVIEKLKTISPEEAASIESSIRQIIIESIKERYPEISAADIDSFCNNFASSEELYTAFNNLRGLEYDGNSNPLQRSEFIPLVADAIQKVIPAFSKGGTQLTSQQVTQSMQDMRLLGPKLDEAYYAAYQDGRNQLLESGLLSQNQQQADSKTILAYMTAVSKGAFANWLAAQATEGYKPLIAKYILHPEQLSRRENQQLINFLVSDKSKIFFDKNGNLVSLADYLNEYYKPLGIKISFEFAVISPDIKIQIVSNILGREFLGFWLSDDRNNLLNDISAGKSYDELKSKYPEDILNRLESIINPDTAVPYLKFTDQKGKIFSTPIMDGTIVGGLGTTVYISNEEGNIISGEMVIDVKRCGSPLDLFEILIHELDHGIAMPLKQRIIDKLVADEKSKTSDSQKKYDEAKRKYDLNSISAEEFSSASEQHAAEVQAIINEFNSNKQSLQKQIDRETIITEGLAETAKSAYLDRMKDNLVTLNLNGIEFNNLFGLLDYQYYQDTPYSVGRVITSYLKSTLSPEQYFTSMYLGDPQTVIDVDSVSDSVQGVINQRASLKDSLTDPDAFIERSRQITAAQTANTIIAEIEQTLNPPAAEEQITPEEQSIIDENAALIEQCG